MNRSENLRAFLRFVNECQALNEMSVLSNQSRNPKTL